MPENPSKPRARDLGLPFEGTPGAFNAITDVGGVVVGFTTLIKGDGPLIVGKGPVRTGVTAILPKGKKDRPSPIWAGHFNLNGNGEMTGTHWIDDAGYFIGPVCITNTHSVGIVHHATVGWMIDHHDDFFQKNHAWAMPVVAETYDGLTNDICGRHITEEHVLGAINSARSGPVPEGNVGGGTGMLTYEFKGGTGTASRMIEIGTREYTVGVLVQSNFGRRKDLRILGVPVGRYLPEDSIFEQMNTHERGSIIVVIGSDLPLLPAQLRRVAKRGALGIGRTGTPGGHYSGDIFLAFSVANHIEPPRLDGVQPSHDRLDFVNDHHMDHIYDAVVQAIEEAIVNAMIAAESMTTVKPPGYTVEAIDHNRLKDIMKQHGRLT